MSETQKSYLLSQNGFSGPLFRMTERYLETGSTVEKSQSSNQRGAIFITTTQRQNDLGQLSTTSARSTKRVRLATFVPTNPENFLRYIATRNPVRGKIDPQEIPVLDLSPSDYSVSLLLQTLASAENQTALEKITSLITSTSLKPPQNAPEILSRISDRSAAGLPVRFACFVCLNTKCKNLNGNPVYFVGQEETRLESSRMSRRTDELISLLANTRLPFTWDFLLADTDPVDIYGEWLSDPDQNQAILQTLSRLRKTLTGQNEIISVKLWSAVQAKYQTQYKRDFLQTASTAPDLTGQDYIQKSVTRRLQYFAQEPLRLPDTPTIRNICELTARRNIALYAAQGPILNSEYDCLVIADPDPTRLGQIQSLLCPQLPIWYPYPG